MWRNHRPTRSSGILVASCAHCCHRPVPRASNIQETYTSTYKIEFSCYHFTEEFVDASLSFLGFFTSAFCPPPPKGTFSSITTNKRTCTFVYISFAMPNFKLNMFRMQDYLNLCNRTNKCTCKNKLCID